MSDEELEELCSKIIDKMMTDDRFFLHMVIQGFGRRMERLAESYEENKEVCTNCGFFKDHCVCEKPQTQADHIREMTDEELAEFLCGVFDDDECDGKYICGVTIPNYDEDRIAEWLKSEVKE